jgi:hypothetical protein
LKSGEKILLEQPHKPIVDEASLGFMFRLAGLIVITTVSLTLLQLIDRIMVPKLKVTVN